MSFFYVIRYCIVGALFYLLAFNIHATCVVTPPGNVSSGPQSLVGCINSLNASGIGGTVN